VICFIITIILNHVFIFIVLITTIKCIDFECILAPPQILTKIRHGEHTNKKKG